jgi:hypothetical protein
MKPMLLLLMMGVVSAQQAGNPSGHWEGTIRLPKHELAITIDIAKNEKGEWIGSADSPSQKLSGVPLANITVVGESLAFGLAGVQEKTVFHGLISADGKSITGGFAQGGSTYPFQLKRTGDADVQLPPRSSRITKELEGSWAGALEAAGKKLRVVLKLSNGAEGAAIGTLDSPDQSARDLPITTIFQKGAELKFDIRIIGATYSGSLMPDGSALVGEWTQAETKLPLTFKRVAKGREEPREPVHAKPGEAQ